mmetsp:Transcript_11184/g.23792  ORF Transcript_11184/g.23792 Transcript_11184/m.23792 type:complete len:86 (-) Transcript_11184:10-267(-)
MSGTACSRERGAIVLRPSSQFLKYSCRGQRSRVLRKKFFRHRQSSGVLSSHITSRVVTNKRDCREDGNDGGWGDESRVEFILRNG